MNDAKVEVERRETRSEDESRGRESKGKFADRDGRSRGRAGGRIEVEQEGDTGIKGAQEAAVDVDTSETRTGKMYRGSS